MADADRRSAHTHFEPILLSWGRRSRNFWQVARTFVALWGKDFAEELACEWPRPRSRPFSAAPWSWTRPKARIAYLNDACGHGTAMRREVEGLLRSLAKAGDFMATPVGVRSDTVASLAGVEGPGTVIGPYRLLEMIGEGGMGVVYLAEQRQPVQRKVALKILKPGMDTRQVMERFEAERQALAMMDHPNIAHILDGGTTEAGRPYFVMDFVVGRADHGLLRHSIG